MAKKFISFLLASVMMLSIVGCGNKTDKSASSNTPNATTDSASVKKDDAKPVELTLWVTSREQDAFSKQQEDAFLKKYPNIKLNKVIREGDPGNDFFQGVAAGNAPDLVSVSFTMMDKYMYAGILQPLNDYMNAWDEGKNFEKYYTDMFSKDGKLYGLPTIVTPMFFGYNKKLFAEAGLKEPPKNWDEMLDFAKKLTKPEKQQYGYNMLAAEWTEWFFQYYVWQAGGDLTKKNADGTMGLTFTDPGVIKAANFYKDLRKAKVTQSDLTMKFEDLIKSFAAGKVGMMPFASDWISWAVSLGAKAEDIGICQFPAGPSGKSTTAIAGGCWVMNAKASKEKQDAAWKYISHYSAKEQTVADLKNKESKGAVNPVIIPRTDVKLKDVVKLTDDGSKALEGIKDSGRLEFYGKATIGSYVDKAVQKIILDPNADPAKEYKSAQDLAEKEVLADFNKSVKAK